MFDVRYTAVPGARSGGWRWMCARNFASPTSSRRIFSVTTSRPRCHVRIVPKISRPNRIGNHPPVGTLPRFESTNIRSMRISAHSTPNWIFEVRPTRPLRSSSISIVSTSIVPATPTPYASVNRSEDPKPIVSPTVAMHSIQLITGT